MEKFPSLGTTSSQDVNIVDDGAARLSKIVESVYISKIYKALGQSSQLTLVGGTVRDILLGMSECDFDLASILPPEETMRLLILNGISVFDTGIKHGTVTAVVVGKNIEITTFRKPNDKNENIYSDSLLEDLSGRDFTVNAIAFSLNEKAIVDPYDGISDLKNNILRTTGSPEKRFREDPLRILRMLRFGQAAGRSVEKHTLESAKTLGSLLKAVSVERIRTELEKILMADFVAAGLRASAKLDLIQYIVPEIIPSIGCEQNKFHTEDVFEHTLSVIENCPKDLRLRIAGLFHDIGKPATLSVDEEGNRHFYSHEEVSFQIAKKVMRRLKFSNDEIHAVGEIVRMHMRPLDCGPAGVRRLMRDLGEYFEDWKIFKTADFPPTMPKPDFEQRYQNFLEMVDAEHERQKKTSQKFSLVDGNDLIALGEPAGKRLGAILKHLENLVIENPEENTREVLLGRAKEIIKTNQAI